MWIFPGAHFFIATPCSSSDFWHFFLPVFGVFCGFLFQRVSSVISIPAVHLLWLMSDHSMLLSQGTGLIFVATHSLWHENQRLFDFFFLAFTFWVEILFRQISSGGKDPLQVLKSKLAKFLLTKVVTEEEVLFITVNFISPEKKQQKGLSGETTSPNPELSKTKNGTGKKTLDIKNYISVKNSLHSKSICIKINSSHRRKKIYDFYFKQVKVIYAAAWRGVFWDSGFICNYGLLG